MPSPVSSRTSLSSTPLTRTSTSSSFITGFPSIVSSSSFSVPSSDTSSTPSSGSSSGSSSSSPSGSSGKSGSNLSETRPHSSATALDYLTTTLGGSSSTKSLEGSSVGVPITSTYISTYTITTTSPDSTTYFTTETITYRTTICPEGSEPIASKGSSTTHISVTQNAHPQHTTTIQTAGAPAQESETSKFTVQLTAASTLSLTHSIAPSHEKTGYHTLSAIPQDSTPSSSDQKYEFVSSSSSKATPYTTKINSVSGVSASSKTTSSYEAVWTGEASKMGRFSALFTVVTMFFTLLFL
ncbi:hypothetical protein N7495_004748 [Penicillium taxi]|uniref:uncharacterized protein n=1 Tax=Penicillium taxi TaxID=168475 RepID=UPI0025459F1D|nr:uncharacterized protein N7495_004748 [Penicillium taxi]KAJ5900004.1 hypothetical protein N7495_004748 [Penicillium taxi]